MVRTPRSDQNATRFRRFAKGSGKSPDQNRITKSIGSLFPMNSPQFSKDNAELLRCSSRIEQAEASQADLAARLARAEQEIFEAEASLNRYREELSRYEGMAAVNPSIEAETRLLRIRGIIDQRASRLRELRADYDQARAAVAKARETLVENRGAVNALLNACNPPAQPT